MPLLPLPCCAGAESRHLVDLPHVYGFDFDLHQCKQCSRYWVYAWFGQGGWEPATPQEAEQMQVLKGSELQSFMKEWAQSFN